MSINVNPNSFSAEQMVFMLALADPNERRTQEEIAKALDVRPETLCRWKRLPGFGEALWALTSTNLEAEVGRVSAVLLEKALRGDHQSMRLYFEILRVVGAQKQAQTCNREHVISMKEFGEGLKKQLTDRELQGLVQEIKEHFGWRSPSDKAESHIMSDEIYVSEEVNLAVS